MTDVATVAERITALRRDKSLPKALRDRLAWVVLRPEATDADVAAALCSVREATLGLRSVPAPVAEVADALARLLRDHGHDPGATSEDADRLALRLRLGCWVVDAPATDGAIIVLGGLPWDRVLATIEAKRAASGAKGLFLSLDVPTAWSWYVGTLDANVRPRIERIRTACERARLVGRGAPSSPWCNEHHFGFVDGATVAFTWRAWGDLQVAVAGEGHYLDHYFGD